MQNLRRNKEPKQVRHTDNERSFIVTWTKDEINKAIEKSYKVLKTYEVWHFNKTTDDLFKGYVRRFMKIKLESSKYDFKMKKEEMEFKDKIKKSSDIDIEKLEFNAGLTLFGLGFCQPKKTGGSFAPPPPPNLAISSQKTMKLGKCMLWVEIFTN